MGNGKDLFTVCVCMCQSTRRGRSGQSKAAFEPDGSFVIR
jgi:hypothetical protein